MDTPTAAKPSKQEAASGMLGRFLSREQAFEFQLNQQVYAHKASARRPYMVHYYYDNEQGIWIPGAYQVCSYYSMWHHVVQDKETREPRLGEPAPEVHEYDCEDQTESSEDSNKELQPDPIDNEIRHSPISLTLGISMSMIATRTAPVVMVAPARAGSLVPVGGTTPASIQGKLNVALQQTGPPGGGGGPGIPGGPGGPEGPGGPGGGPGQVQVLQQPITPAGNVKTIGQLPQTFTGNQARVDDFIEEVKGYL
jgi:hypothetical protein